MAIEGASFSALARVYGPSIATTWRRHASRRPPPTTPESSRIGAQLEGGGHQILSAREIFARQRAEGRRVFSAQLSERRFHRPDLILGGEPPEAIEVELTDKSARRLDELLRAWRRAVARGQFERNLRLAGVIARSIHEGQ